jgi:hypothetical protein
MRERFRLVVVLALVLGLAVATVIDVQAQGEEPPVEDPVEEEDLLGMDLVDVLGLLATGAGLSFLLEWSAGFESLSPGQKRAVVAAITLGVPVLAQVALTFVPAEVWPVINPYWRALAAGFTVLTASQFTHKADKATE